MTPNDILFMTTAILSGTLIGLIIWAVRSWKVEQVEKPEFRIHEVHQSEVL